MSEAFGALSTADDVLARLELGDKRVLITGVSSGLGLETTRALVSKGVQVTGTVRDFAKAQSALEQVCPGAVTSGSVELIDLDLASLASARACADRLVNAGSPFDLVITNAGVMACPFERTADGFEMQFGTNHLGHFIFVNRIAPLLMPGSRVVSVSSSGHSNGDVDLGDPNFERVPYDPWVAYGRSKTANILFAVEFDRRHRDRGVRGCAVHPGAIATELYRHMPEGVLETMVDDTNARLAVEGGPLFWFKTAPQGVATSMWAGLFAKPEDIGGRYCEDCQVSTEGDDNDVTATGGGIKRYALDPERAAALWAKSCK